MALVEHIRSTFREFQLGWDRMAERAFGSAPDTRDDAARGEFTSAFISERDLSFPAVRHDSAQR